MQICWPYIDEESDSQILVGFANPGRWDAGTLDAGIPIRSKFWSENIQLGLRPALPPGVAPLGLPAPVPCLTADTQGSYAAGGRVQNERGRVETPSCQTQDAGTLGRWTPSNISNRRPAEAAH